MEIIFLFVLGLCVGSFLNVLVDRLPKNESIVKSRSHCDHCRRKLAWMDLIPVVSFILLNGKCRYCRSPISFFYPLLELITGSLFILIFISIPDQNIKYQISNIKYILTTGYYLFIISALIVVFFTDLKYGIIPDKIVYSAILISIFFLISLPAMQSNALQAGQYPNVLISNLLSAIFAFAFFLLVFVITHGKGMGFGDVKLVFLLGLFLGFPKIVVALYAAFLLGAMCAVLLIIIKRKKFYKDTIPFGPFLVIGTILALFLGDTILKNYMTFLI